MGMNTAANHFRASWITSCIHAWIPACWWLRSAFHPRSPQRELKGEGMRGKGIGEGEWLPEDRQEPPRVGVENWAGEEAPATGHFTQEHVV